MDPFALIAQYGWSVGGLLIIVWAFYFDLIVTGTRYKKLENEKDRWQYLALDQAGITRSALNIAERHTISRDSGVSP